MPVSPEEMQAMQAQVGKNQDGGVVNLAKKVGEGLQKLVGMLNESSVATDQDKAKAEQMLQAFVELVETNLTQAPGQDPEMPEDPNMSEVPMQAGMKGQPIGPQSKN